METQTNRYCADGLLQLGNLAQSDSKHKLVFVKTSYLKAEDYKHQVKLSKRGLKKKKTQSTTRESSRAVK